MCQKQRYNTRRDAEKAAVSTTRGTLDFGRVQAYRCTKCRKPNGQPGGAWHWGHNRSNGRRKQW